MENRKRLNVGDSVRLKKELTKTFPRPMSVIIGFLNGDPGKPGCGCIHVDLDSRIDGKYIHPIDHLESVGAI